MDRDDCFKFSIGSSNGVISDRDAVLLSLRFRRSGCNVANTAALTAQEDDLDDKDSHDELAIALVRSLSRHSEVDACIERCSTGQADGCERTLGVESHHAGRDDKSHVETAEAALSAACKELGVQLEDSDEHDDSLQSEQGHADSVESVDHHPAVARA